jgi:rod shape-determining protein MreD
MRTTTGRPALLVAVVVIVMIVQISVLPLAAPGVVTPNLCLIMVVAVGLARGARAAMPLGFGLGLVVDLAPSADHVVGRWALGLVLAGYVAGHARRGAAATVAMTAVTIAVCSLVASMTFTLTGLVVGDLGVEGAGLLRGLGLSMLWDVLLLPLAFLVGRRLLGPRERRAVLV